MSELLLQTEGEQKDPARMRDAVARQEADACFTILSAAIATAITLIKMVGTARGVDRADAEQARRRARHVLHMAALALEDQCWAASERSALASALADLARELDSWPPERL